MERTFLIYASAFPGDSNRIAPNDKSVVWVRVEEYRGGANALEYGERNALPHETFVNSVTLDYPDEVK